MTDMKIFHPDYPARTFRGSPQSGFGLTEFLIAALVVLITASSVFVLITEMQRKAGYQAEVQAVLNNTRIAMQTVGGFLRQAGNDPLGTGLAGVSIVSSTEVGIRSDVTGSLGPATPDKGDPDGDVDDSGEHVTIRYNSRTRSLEIVPFGSSAQIAAGYISGLAFRYYDAQGLQTAIDTEVRRIRVTISGASAFPDPQTNRVFAVELSSDFKLPG